jgi:hypothetical protein
MHDVFDARVKRPSVTISDFGSKKSWLHVRVHRDLETYSQYGKSPFIRPASLPGSRMCTRADHQEMSSPNTVAQVLVKLNMFSAVKRGKII